MSTTDEESRAAPRCPACGQDNSCGFGSSAPCWCAAPGLDRLKPDTGADTCYCRACLERLLAELTRSRYLTSRTGISDKPITFVATEPSRRLATEPCPRVPMAMRLHRCSRA